jgi:acyl carrier protein
MTTLEFIELNNIDPEDIGDLLVKIEKSFHIKFGKNELTEVKTFGELCDIIQSKVKGQTSTDCTTQQAFYKLRKVISEITTNSRPIDIDTSLEEILPRRNRRLLVKQVDTHFGFRTNILSAKDRITTSLMIFLVLSLISLIWSWKVGIAGITLAVVLTMVANKFGKELSLKTAGELANKISREHYRDVRRHSMTVNPKEITEKVKEIFKEDLGLDDSALSREATFN